MCKFSRARQLYYTADALAWLPAEAGQAQDYATQAVTAYEDTGARNGRSVTPPEAVATFAVARIALGDVDGPGRPSRQFLTFRTSNGSGESSPASSMSTRPCGGRNCRRRARPAGRNRSLRESPLRTLPA